MRIGIIGRTEILYETALLLLEQDHELVHFITAKEAPEYTKTSSDFCELAKKCNAPFIHSPRINEQMQMVTETNPDIGISINYPGIIPKSVIDCYPNGILNSHGGDLPRYRGNACQAWAILNGEERIGLCIHKMIGDELDSGDIIARKYLAIDDNTKITECWKWMKDQVPLLFLIAIDSLQQDSEFLLEHQSIIPGDALRCYPRRPEDGRIDWAQNNLDILRLINASNKPYAGAFCEFESEKMIVWDAELVKDKENFCAVPGQVTFIGDKYVEVACRAGKLRLKEVEITGETNTPDRWIKSIRKRLL